MSSPVSSPPAHRPDRAAADHGGHVRGHEVAGRLPAQRVSDALAETFSVLADPGRVRLIAALLEAPELCVCELASATGLSQTACSHNLRLLRSRRLVRRRRQGRNIFYALDDDHIHQLLAVALEHVRHGDEQCPTSVAGA